MTLRRALGPAKHEIVRSAASRGTEPGVWGARAEIPVDKSKQVAFHGGRKHNCSRLDEMEAQLRGSGGCVRARREEQVCVAPTATLDS